MAKIRFYSHEPYETCYYKGEPKIEAFKNLINSINLGTKYKAKNNDESSWLLIKEMVY